MAPDRGPAPEVTEFRAPAVAQPTGTPPAGTWAWVRAAAVVVTLFVIYQLVVVFAGWLTTILTVILAVVVAVAITFICDPVVTALRRRTNLPAGLATVITLVVGLFCVFGVLYLVGGPLVGEARSLATQIPHLLHHAGTEIEQLRSQLAQHGIDVGSGSFSPRDLTKYIPGATSILLHGLSGTLTVLVVVFVGLIISFWLLKDGRALRQQMLELLPSRVRSEVAFGLDAFTVVIGGYVRAQLLMALLVAVLATGGTFFLGVPFPLVIGVATFIFELVPLIGPFAGGAVAVLLALTKNVELALFTVILFLIIHVIEGYLLAPRIQARFVHLHPVVALLALFAGIEAAGFLGALFAVPVASLLAVFVRAGLLDWRQTRPDLFGARAAQLAAGEAAPGRRVLREFTPIHRDAWNWIKRRAGRHG